MKEFESLQNFKKYLSKNTVIEEVAVQSLDLASIEDLLAGKTFRKCIFMGCHMSNSIREQIYKENHIFPSLDVPYNMYPNKLYDKNSLYNDYDPRNPTSYEKTLDKIVYDHYLKTGKTSTKIEENLARRLHDHSITDAIQEFLDNYDEKRIIAIMGGHGLGRDSDSYRKVAEIAKEMTENGYLMISGGGPGAMEATHLGAWFANKTADDLKNAIAVLSKAPVYNHPDWLRTAFLVLEEHPNAETKSLGIPTWLYGHEPPTPFATHIGKYFANSVREEGLLAIAKGGVIFAPGSAGTLQEIFQEIAQNHYKSFGNASPMVFLNKNYWSYERPVYPIIELMKHRGDLQNLDIGLYDTKEEIMEHLMAFT